MIYFTGDTHFGHTGAIEFCKRPFKDVEEMDEELIRRWNVCVGKEDMIFHLGDFAFYGATKTRAILKRLNGFKILVVGNHDHRDRKMVELGFDLAVPYGSLNIEGKVYRLSHYPFKGQSHDKRDFSDRALEDNKIDHLIHGHVHDTWKRKNRMVNVGVDVWDYAPVSLKETTE